MPPGKPRAGFQQETLIYTENTTLTGSEGDAPAVCGLAGVPGRMEAKRSLGAGPALSSGPGPSSVPPPGFRVGPWVWGLLLPSLNTASSVWGT